MLKQNLLKIQKLLNVKVQNSQHLHKKQRIFNKLENKLTEAAQGGSRKRQRANKKH